MLVVLALVASLSFSIRVVDPAGAPIPNASVTVTTRDARVHVQVRTDATGTAQLAVAGEQYILQIEAAGFASLTRAIDASDQESPLQLTLALAGVHDRVVVTASGDLQTADEVSKAVSVIDTREIEARDTFTVVDAIRTVPGISVQQLGGPGSFTSIKLRGLREQDTAVLIDGVRFRDAGAPQGDATGFAGELYLTNLDRIEVLRGSGSSLYGSHAVGGAINLITRAGSSAPTANLRVEAGGLGLTHAAGHAGTGTEGGRLRLSVGAGHTQTSRGVDGDDRATNSSLQARGDVRVGAAATASARLYVSDADSKINESPGAIGPLPTTGFVAAIPMATFTPSLNDPDNVRDSRFRSTLLRFDHRASPRLGYSASWHRLTTTRTYLDGPLGPSPFEPVGPTTSAFDGALDTLDARADVDWNARHQTTFAYERERERFVSRSMPVNPSAAWDADIVQTSHSLSLQQQLRLPSLSVAASARAQGFSLERAAFTPADRAPFSGTVFTTPPTALTADLSAARWIATTSTKLRTHVGNAYRAPSMYERAGSSFGSRDYTVYGDPRLGPERSLSVDAGIDQTLFSGRARLSATVYRARLRRVIAFGAVDRATDPFGRSSGYLPADGRVAKGVELSARLEPSLATALDVAYTFADAAPPAGNREGLPRASAVPAHQLSALMIQRIGTALQFSLQVEAAGDHYVTLFDPVSFGSRAYRFDGVIKADVAAAYTVPLRRLRLRLSGIVENVLDRESFVQGFRAPRRIARVGVTFLL
jgi:vitamin B12 transporter